MVNTDELAGSLAWRLVELIEDKANANLGWDPDGELIQNMRAAVEYAIKQTPTGQWNSFMEIAPGRILMKGCDRQAY